MTAHQAIKEVAYINVQKSICMHNIMHSYEPAIYKVQCSAFRVESSLCPGDGSSPSAALAGVQGIQHLAQVSSLGPGELRQPAPLVVEAHAPELPHGLLDQ